LWQRSLKPHRLPNARRKRCVADEQQTNKEDNFMNSPDTRPPNGHCKEKRIVLVMHDDDPVTDRVQSFCVKNGFKADIRKPFAGDTLGSPDEDLAGTVLLGGTQIVYDFETNPFLHEEYRWLSECLDAGVPILGICMGAQQIAHHLGAKVAEMENECFEFGYYAVFPTEDGQEILDETLIVAHSHHQAFDIPKGAVHLACSELCRNQAYRYGNKVYAFQFHPERVIEGFQLWQERYEKKRAGLPGVQSREEQNRLMHLHDQAAADWFSDFLDKFFGATSGRAEVLAE
jgi:GMP synthase (glutamine-hydrolysing)